MNARAIHLISDDKFLIKGLNYFKSLNKLHNEVVLLDFKSIEQINFVRELTPKSFKSKRELKFYLDKEQYDYLIIHSIRFNYTLIENIDKKIKIFWISWGFDIYQDIFYRCISYKPLVMDLYKPLTRKKLATIHLYLKYIYSSFLYRKKKNSYKQFLRRVDYCNTVIPEEYQLIKSSISSNFIAKFFPFNYYDNYLSYLKIPLIRKTEVSAVLLGNSATPTNNHYDILSKLKGVKNKIIVPLNYGDFKYRGKLTQWMNKSLKELDIVMLTKMISYDKYIDIISTCNYAIMGHVRQQAVGNIDLCFLMGIKVFLYEDSILYQHYKNRGIYVFTIERDLSIESLLQPLSINEKEHNRIIVLEYIQNNYKLFKSFFTSEILK